MMFLKSFQTQAGAVEFLEYHIWPDGPSCPFCGETKKIGRLSGASTAPGTFKCYSCRKRFSLHHKSIFAGSHVPLHIWMRAIYLLAATEHVWGAHRLSEALGISIRTAWSLKRKICKAAKRRDVSNQVDMDRHAQGEPLNGNAVQCEQASPQLQNGYIGKPQDLLINVEMIDDPPCADRRFQHFLAVAALFRSPQTDQRFQELLLCLISVDVDSHEQSQSFDDADTPAQFSLPI